jgi:hypothetical protein
VSYTYREIAPLIEGLRNDRDAWRALADDLADALIWLVELAATTSIDRGIANYPEIAGPLARYREASQR